MPKFFNFLAWIPVLVVAHEHGMAFVRVSGRSMQPTFNPDSSCLKEDIVLVDKFLYNKSTNIKRGDLVTFWYPNDRDILLTKRVLGLEGDLIKTNQYLNPPPSKMNNKSIGGLVRIPMGHCWVEGDSQFHSKDRLINSKVVHIVWPISRFGAPSGPPYDVKTRSRNFNSNLNNP